MSIRYCKTAETATTGVLSDQSWPTMQREAIQTVVALANPLHVPGAVTDCRLGILPAEDSLRFRSIPVTFSKGRSSTTGSQILSP